MAKKGSFSKVYDKNGDYVDVEAARFDGTRTFQMQGDVTASQTWNGDPSSPLTLNASIGAKKVTTDKINDKAVQAQQIDDGAVGLTQIATTAMNGTVQDNDSKLATHAAVKTYVDSQISGQGTYLGKHTVAEINAMVTDNLHNGDRVMTSDSGTINLGPGGIGFDVEAGEDLILYKSGSTVQWDSMDGNFKTKQSAVVDPTASGSTLEFIDSITQDENGEITASKKAVQDGSTSQKGVVQLAGSIGATVASENNKAASEKAVRDAINALDSNATSADGTNVQVKVTETDGKISAVNITTDNTENKNNKVSSWQGTPDNTHYPTEKLVKDGLDAKADANKVVAIADSTIARRGNTGDGWYKVAESDLATGANTKRSSCWRLIVSNTPDNKTPKLGNLLVSVQAGANTGDALNVRQAVLFADDWNTTYNPVKLVVRGTTENATIELWVKVGVQYSGMNISELLGTGYYGVDSKIRWTYTSYDNNGGSAAPVTDASNNVTVTDVDVVIRQHAIASPTNNNLVAMDASGLVKDSGLTKSSVESAISAAGSAIQGVKVNETTLTPDANKVVTVPLATTSADGAMSAADKTKLNGIAAGAEVNVQADWMQTVSSADDLVKNKPLYKKYMSAATIFKVCTAKANNNTEVSYFKYLVRFKDGSVIGEVVFRNGVFIFQKNAKATEASTSTATVKFYSIASETTGFLDIYASAGAYTELRIDAISNGTLSVQIDFTNMGTNVTSLPEGATEITPVWVANSASSSGTAPVKVDAYGALTPVPMDSTPTASSTNLMTSGDIKTALDNIVVDANTRYPFGVRQTRTASYGYKLFNVKFSTAQSATRIRVSGNLVVGVGTSGHTERISFDLIILNTNAAESNPSNIYLNTTSTRRGSRVARLAYKAPTNWSDGLDVYLLWSADGATSSSNYAYGWEIVLQEATTSSVEVKDENLTSALTGFTLDYTRTSALIEGTSAVGSSGTPVYVTADGVVTACTVDSAPTASSANLVTSGGVRSELDSKPFIYVARRNTDADDAFASNEGNRFRVIEYTNASSHLPTSAFYHIYSSVGPDRSYQVQLALGMTSQDCYFRRRRLVDNVATWSEWKKFIFEGDLTSALNNKQDLLPTSGIASDSYAINITGNAATATKPSFVTLTSSDDLNNIKGSERGDILEYVWLNTSIPSNVPVSGSSGILLVVHKGSSQYTKQICFVPGSNRIWCRYQSNGSWGTWAQFLETRDVKSTYSSSDTDPVNGTAVAAALGTLDVTDTAVSHQFVTAVSETDGKVSITREQPVIADVDGLQTALDGKEGSITWMTEQEARSIWTNAKAAVAAS